MFFFQRLFIYESVFVISVTKSVMVVISGSVKVIGVSVMISGCYMTLYFIRGIDTVNSFFWEQLLNAFVPRSKM